MKTAMKMSILALFLATASFSMENTTTNMISTERYAEPTGSTQLPPPPPTRNIKRYAEPTGSTQLPPPPPTQN